MLFQAYGATHSMDIGIWVDVSGDFMMAKNAYAYSGLYGWSEVFPVCRSFS